MLALEAWAGVTKRAAGHIWTALGQMVLCFRAARVTWEAIWCERAQIRHVMKNDLRGIVLVLKWNTYGSVLGDIHMIMTFI